MWQNLLPDSLLLEIFSYLDAPELGVVAQVCKKWRRVSVDEHLWQNIARSKWSIEGPIAPDKQYWREEVKRLSYHVPSVCCETFRDHSDEVLDVAFSHNGKYFCTSSKDALAIIWELGCPSRKMYVADMNRDFDWALCQFSAFNKDDSLLLVCGVKNIKFDEEEVFDRPGVGVIFSISENDVSVVGIVCLEPPTLSGSWLDNTTVVGGLPSRHTDTLAYIMAYKVREDSASTKCLHVHGHKVLTIAGDRYHLMNLLVAKVSQPTRQFTDRNPSEMEASNFKTCDSEQGCAHSSSKSSVCAKSDFLDKSSDGFKRQRMTCHGDEADKSVNSSDVYNTSSAPVTACSDIRHDCPFSRGSSNELNQFYVIFVTGQHDTIVVHKVTDQSIESSGCDSGADFTYQEALRMVKKADFTFVYKDCYITGAALSPDERYVYINYREMDAKHPANQNTEHIGLNVMDKVFSESIKIGCIDLQKMCKVKDATYQGHIGYSTFPAWYICLDISQDYVGSCSEDNRVYIWDRYYKIPVAILAHEDVAQKNRKDHSDPKDPLVTNGIAFSPVDQEICVTVNDDQQIKVWKSRNRLVNAHLADTC